MHDPPSINGGTHARPLSLTNTHLQSQLPNHNKGISFKTQALYLVVFLTRYLDLFTSFVSVYNTVMKIAFIVTAAYILFLMFFKFKASWDPALDTFRVEFLLVPAAVLALFVRAASKHPIIEVRMP